MEREPAIEELLNIIKLQEKALEYYANKKNYSGAIDKMQILKDRGEQARFILKQSEMIRNYESDMIEKVKEALEESEDIDLLDTNTKETISKIDQIKNIFKNI